MGCLAKHSDELWHLAKIESLDENKICVQFKKINFTCALDWESILLLNGIEPDDDDDDISETDSFEEKSEEVGSDGGIFYFPKYFEYQRNAVNLINSAFYVLTRYRYRDFEMIFPDEL